MTQWQAEALLQLRDQAEFLLLNCTNTRLKRRPVRHGLYYALNLISLRPPPTRSAAIPQGLRVKDQLDFESDWDGAWQRLPASVLQRLDEWQPELALKFGMGLMRVPPELQCKVLSYHHGDPRRYRGRPAGFYELMEGTVVIGQMVQIISNRLDGGEVVAFAETRVHPYSYRGTMDEAYRTSPFLIGTAVRNALSGVTLPLKADGKNYRLPSNATVSKLALKLGAAKARRLSYGAFFDKAWKVASVRGDLREIADVGELLADRSAWTQAPMPSRYEFLADPFPHPNGGILVEALRRSDGQGEITHLDHGEAQTLCTGAGHFSYPSTIDVDGQSFILPEVSEWTGPKLYRLTAGKAEPAGDLEIEGEPRIADATLYAKDSTFYLFGNDIAEGSGILRLWIATSLFGPFAEHPLSPIRISPAGSRMAGNLVEIGKKLYRLGQDGSRGYGKGIVAFEVTALSTGDYAEQEAAQISFDQVNGPHTFNRRSDFMVFDFYDERFSPFAGVNRIRARLAKRKALKARS